MLWLRSVAVTGEVEVGMMAVPPVLVVGSGSDTMRRGFSLA